MAKVGILQDGRSSHPSLASSHRAVYHGSVPGGPPERTGISSIEGLFYSIRWAHKLAGIECCPTNHPLVKSSLEGDRRKMGRPSKPKEPLPIDLLQVITEHYSSSGSLAHIRFLFILLVGFTGFFPD